MTQPRLSIRDAQPGDTPAIQRIVSTVLAEFRLPFNLNTTDADLRDVAGSYVARGGAFRVLVDGENEVVGCGGLFQKSDDEAELRKMYFMPAVRGLGYGHALLDNLIQFARARGYKRVVLESASQLTTAIGMYRATASRTLVRRPKRHGAM